MRSVIPEEVPATVGVPLTAPVEAFRVRPVGKVPAVLEKV
jgi:hypothetical protein